MAAYKKRWICLFVCWQALSACGHFAGQSALLWPLIEQWVLPIAASDTPALPAAAAPVMSPTNGTYSADQNVMLASATVGADIRYTVDGSNPDETSALYSAPIPVTGNGTSMTIKAIAIKPGMSNSAIVTSAYTINYSQVSTPAMSPVGGTYNSDQTITITCATGGATIHYTDDGNTPTAGSPTYAGPITVSSTGTHTIKAIAILGGMTDSTIRTEVYTIQDATAPTPGGGGTITPSAIAGTSLTLSWTAATDDYTPSANLEYLVCQSTSNNLDTLANTQANCGTPVNGMAWTANLTTVNATGLASNTLYYFNVLVRDTAAPANVSVYTMVSHWTLGPDGDADGVPDTFDNCPHDANSTQAITAPNAGPYGDACTLNGHAWIEFNTTATGANVATDQLNFPVLVRITDPAIIDAVQNGAPDLRFVDGTISHPTPGPYLKYEVEFWDKVTDTAAVWVLVPRVHGNDNTHHITMYYDDAVAGAVADAQAPGTVFDTANHFSGVWHLHGFNDATTNANNGTNNGTADVTGIIGHGKSFNGSAYIQIPGLLGTPANVTLSAWVQLDTADTKGSEVISLGDYATIRMDDNDAGFDNGTHAAFYDGSNWSALIHSPGLFYAGPQWHYLTATFDDTNHVQKFYVDGVEVVSDSFMMSIAYSGQGSHTFIGTHGNGGTIYDFTGIMDEVRVSNTPRSTDWIKLEYENQRSSGQCLVTVTPH